MKDCMCNIHEVSELERRISLQMVLFNGKSRPFLQGIEKDRTTSWHLQSFCDLMTKESLILLNIGLEETKLRAVYSLSCSKPIKISKWIYNKIIT